MLLVFTGGRVQLAETDSLGTDFYTSIRLNDLPRVQKLAATKAAVNTADTQGETPLMYAAGAGSLDAIKLLLAAGADVNHQSASGATALMFAATDVAKTRALLDAGADPNKASKSGKTALLLAAMSDPSIEIVRLLISKGASIKAGLSDDALRGGISAVKLRLHAHLVCIERPNLLQNVVAGS